MKFFISAATRLSVSFSSLSAKISKTRKQRFYCLICLVTLVLAYGNLSAECPKGVEEQGKMMVWSDDYYSNAVSYIETRLMHFRNAFHKRINGQHDSKYVTVIKKYHKDILGQLDPYGRGETCNRELFEVVKGVGYNDLDYTKASTANLIKSFYLNALIKDVKPNMNNKDLKLHLKKHNGIKYYKYVTKCRKNTTPYDSYMIYFDKGIAFNNLYPSGNKKTSTCNKSKKEIFMIKDGTYICNITMINDLYVKEGAQSGHITIARQFVLRLAGEVTFKKGKIAMLNNRSGHYTPSIEELKNAFRELRKKHGVNIFDPNFQLIGIDFGDLGQVLGKSVLGGVNMK
ncbi:MAG: hypothetical protein GY754_11080 [bacterium]|nr:hypothetical protein [bacterium]